MKLRFEGTREEIDWLVLGLRKVYDVREVSKFYPNRDGKTFRAYVEVVPFFVRSGSRLDSKNLALEVDGVESAPRPYDVVLGATGEPPEAIDKSRAPQTPNCPNEPF